MPVPKKGDVVMFLGPPVNDLHEYAGILTQVWNPERDTVEGAVFVNITVFPDGRAPMFVDSVPLHQTAELALAYRYGRFHTPVAWYPGRALA
jgi:hypothetical protein